MAVTLFALPASSIALLFSLALGLTDATPWAEPAVQTLAYRAHEWSPRPTGVTNEPAKLFKRSSLDVGICGWLGGNEALPAQCSSRSSCVHDTIHGVVGCCTTDGACLQGVYTNCLDNKSGGWAATPVVKNDGVTMWYVAHGSNGKMETDDATALGHHSATGTLTPETIINIHVEIRHQRQLSRRLMMASQRMRDYKWYSQE
jgi:hypothetical protein